MKALLTVGITDCSKWENYARWIENAGPGFKVVKLSWKNHNLKDVELCDGIILSGGEDVHPKFYGKPEYLEKLDPKDIIEKRDEFELEVIDAAMKNKLPVLGICRGLQIANVYFKGTLIPDIPSIGKSGHAKEEGYDQTHLVLSEYDSVLRRIASDKGTVNSAHHQSAGKIGSGLKVSATSEDGIVEGLEWKSPEGKPFLLLVQWHPERMKEQESPFSKNIREEFLKNLKKN
jgi:putative glutamine amidotransferase